MQLLILRIKQLSDVDVEVSNLSNINYMKCILFVQDFPEVQ